MDFRKHLRVRFVPGVNLVPLVDIVLLLFIFFTVAPMFTGISPMKVKLPGAVTSDIVNDGNITVIISSENILFYNNKVVTLPDVKDLLSQPRNARRPILIKVDRRASVGRVVDLWNLGRSMGIERIDVASDRDD